MGITELKALYENATKGKWRHEMRANIHVGSQHVASFLNLKEVRADGRMMTSRLQPGTGEANAALIVALHNSFPALLARMEALEKVAEAARSAPSQMDHIPTRKILQAALSSLDSLRADSQPKTAPQGEE